MSTIEKIISINSVGRFVNYKATGDVTLKKINLIYGENGCGKTTLCSILRSLRGGDPSYIFCRKTFGIPDSSPNVQLLLKNNYVHFSGGNWNITEPNIRIFDYEFVQKNIFASSVVEHEQKKNLYRIIMGEHGVSIAHEIERLDEIIAEINQQIKLQENKLYGFCGGLSIDDFCKIPKKENIEQIIAEKQSQLEQEKKILKEKEDILRKDGLSQIGRVPLPTDIIDILQSSIDNVVVGAEEKLKNHMCSLNMPSNGQHWISQGIDFIRNDKCPFCGQSIEQNDLISAYKSFFNAEYMDLKAKVEKIDLTPCASFIGKKRKRACLGY